MEKIHYALQKRDFKKLLMLVFIKCIDYIKSSGLVPQGFYSK